MVLTPLKPRQSLNKAFLKVKPNRTDIDRFKANLIALLESTKDNESEEYHKNLVIDFLKKTYYDPNHFINTKGRNDLVIHNGPKPASTVGVILEAKNPTNKSEMITVKKINAKAFQELVLYYLRERITLKNLEVRHLAVTNINEWFIFDATTFDRLFAQNKSLVQQFNDFETGRLADTKTDFFYKQIAEPFIDSISSEISFTYFNIQDYQVPLRNGSKADDGMLIALYKLLSPEHLLKLPFANDSNSLDKRFYSELLHIIGLAEFKDGGKKVIRRNNPGERYDGAILEDAILQLDSLDKISRLKNPRQFGDTSEERLFNVAIELSITWVNRILFLKLLEAQLITYHKGDKSFAFLNLDKVKNYDELNKLFFQVLARKHSDRTGAVAKTFEKTPYLNSSLFEPTEIEHDTLFISNLSGDRKMPVYAQTVLKDKQGRKRIGEMDTLEYLFEFLSAYDFSSEGAEDIQEDNKTLINASVLGLIFEKINGYKDGSFFTPGYITMYMCRETIRKAVVQKFNDVKGWSCSDLDTLYDKIENIKEANDIVNGIRICDPAVGSGHFLVSALNEMIAVKSELKILQDRNGRRLKEYHVEVVNDELIITDEDGDLFEYNPGSKESQRIQETLFHEKQTIIENCLFGVDINPNSVKICRLRLWIELLKSAYYKNETELETLPNIDINIKCGNSLVSRFTIDADIKQALNKKWTIQSYRTAVASYRNAQSKEQKREFEQLISEIKSDFRSEISKNDPKAKKLYKTQGELTMLMTQQSLFGMNKKEKAEWNKKVERLTGEVKKLDAEIEEIKSNKIFENAFEWRFEFPEVLDDDGDFVGFDVVMGNPPYVNFRDIKNVSEKQYFMSVFKVSEYQSDLFILFIELAFRILRGGGEFGFIIPNSIANNLNNSKARKHILDAATIRSIVNTPIGIFPDATVDTVVLVASFWVYKEGRISISEVRNQEIFEIGSVDQSRFQSNDNFYFDFLTSGEVSKVLAKIEGMSVLLGDISDSSSGIKEYETGKGKPPQTDQDRIDKVFNSNIKVDDLYRRHIQGNDVCSYFLNWQGGYLKYGPWIAAPREPKYFEGERVIIREIPAKNRLIAAYITEDFTVKNTAHIFKLDKEYDCRFITGLLNSKLLGFYFVNKFSERDNVFPKAKIGQCRLLPIVKCDEHHQTRLVELVNEVLLKKQLDAKTDTTEIEREIDVVVYELYKLSPDEIHLVEGL
ncbi:MAG: Eco57I restriction-modification methylase domain-containing protein [Flavobacteriales bacterium]